MNTLKPNASQCEFQQKERGLVMPAGAFLCVLFLIFALPSNAKEKSTSNQKENSSEKICMLVSRPVCASPAKNTGDAWFAALCEAYYQVRLGTIKKVEVVPSESLYQYIPKYRDFSQEISQNEYNECIARFRAAYLLCQKYELMAGGKEFSYYADFVRTSDNKTLFTVEKISSIENLGRLLDSCIICMQKNACVLKPDQFSGSFQVSILGENGKNLLRNCKQLGALLLNDNYTKSENPMKITKAYKGLIGGGPPMLLALYAAGIAHMRINDFGASAEMLSDFVKSVRDYAPVLPALGKSYRMCGRFYEAQKCFELAKNAGASSVQLLLENALTCQAVGDLKKTGELYGAILTRDDDQPDALRFFAWQNNEQNNAAAGLSFAERLLAVLPRDGTALLEKGRSLWLMKKYDKASESLWLARRLMPEAPLPVLYLGDVYRQTGDYAQSSACYEQAMNLMPADPYTGLKAAEACALAGNTQKALSLLKMIEPKFPGNAMLLKKLGLLEYQLADKENARKHLEKYEEREEKDFAVVMALASCYSASNEIDKSIDMYTKALSVAEDKNLAELELAKCYLTKGEPKKAVRHLTCIISRSPNFDHVNKYLAQAMEITGDRKKAMVYYEKEQTLYGDTKEFLEKLGAAFFEFNNMPEAEREYLKLIKIDTANSAAYFRLAIINLKKGNIEKADDFCLIGGRYAGGDADLYYQIGLGYANAGKPGKAVEYLSKSIAIASTNVKAWQQLAAALLSLQKDSAAAEACLQVFELDAKQGKEYLVKAAGLYGHMGKTDKAKELYDRFLEQGFASQSVCAELSSIEFMNKNYKRVIELQKDLSGKAGLAGLGTCLMLAESYCETGQYDEALPYCAKALAQSPNNRKALELSVLAYENLGDNKKALCIQEKLMGLPGGTVQWRRDLAFHAAQLYEEQNQKDKAMRAYLKNITEYPDDVRNFERAAGLCVADKNWKRAEGLLENAGKLTNATPLLRKMLAQSYAAQGNRTNAAVQYKQYLSLAPADSTAWNELGMVLFEQEHFVEAKEILQKAATLMPGNFDCLSLLGSCCIKTGKMADAIIPLEKAHAIRRGDIQAMAYLDQCYLSVGESKKRAALFMEWATAEPRNCKVLKDCGELLLGEGKAREAVNVLENASALDSNDARINFLLAKGYEKLGKPSATLARLEKALANDSVNADIQYEIGKILNARKQYAAARPYLEKAIAIDSLNAAARFEYSCLLRAQKNYDRAFTNAEAAVKCEPYNIAYLMQEVQTAYACGKKDLAFGIIKALYAKDQSSLEILQWAGVLYKECGEIEIARQILEKAITRSASCASCYKNLGDIYINDGNFEKAINAYGQALAMGRFDESAALGLGVAYLNSGDMSRARQMFEKTIQEVPKSDEALYWLGSVYVKLDKTDKALELLARLSNGRKSAWIHCIQGEISEAEGKIDEALISFTVAANLMPENPRAHTGAGRMHLKNQRYEKAIENFGKALAHDPNNVRSLLGLGEACEGLGQNDSALDIYTKAASKAPNDPDVYVSLGAVLSKRQEHQKSVAVLEKGVACDPKNVRVLYAIAGEYRLLARLKDAIAAYKKVIKYSKDEYAGAAAQAYRNLGDICFYDLKDGKGARKYYEKYMESGGRDEKVVQFVASMKN